MFHGIEVNVPNGHRPGPLRWKPFPRDYLERALEPLGSWPFLYDPGVKDKALHVSLGGTHVESLEYYEDDEPVKKERPRKYPPGLTRAQRRRMRRERKAAELARL